MDQPVQNDDIQFMSGIYKDYRLLLSPNIEGSYSHITDETLRTSVERLLSDYRVTSFYIMQCIGRIYAEVSGRGMNDLAGSVLNIILSKPCGDCQENVAIRISDALHYCFSRGDVLGIRRLLQRVPIAKTITAEIYPKVRSVCMLKAIENEGVILPVIGKDSVGHFSRLSSDDILHCEYEVLEHLLSRRLISTELILSLLRFIEEHGILSRADKRVLLFKRYTTDNV